MAVDEQTLLREFIERRHPEYDASLLHWDFLEATYKGGREWFTKDNIFRYLKEGESEFNQRLGRTYRFNHTREVTDLVQKYIFKSPVARSDDAPDIVKAFWENVTTDKLDIDQFMKLVSTQSSVLGRPWIFTDTVMPQADGPVSVSQAKQVGARVYAYIVRPQDVLDMGFSKDGELLWVKLRERVRDDVDPIRSSGEIEEFVRLWTKDVWILYQEQQDGRKKNKKVVVVDFGTNEIGVIPGFPVPHVINNDLYVAPALIDDIAYLDRACANYLSNLDAIIQDQTFSQLAMPAQSMMPGEENYDKTLEMGTRRIFLYDGEGGSTPEYLSPDVKQAQLIVTVINKIINEIYHTIGMAGERTKEDNAVGIDNSSGVAKAYDFERMNSLLTAKAASLENAENKLVELVCLWNSQSPPEQELVKYPDTFDVRSLFDEFTVAERLALVDAPESVRQEQMKQVVDKLFPRLSAELRAKMEADIGKWPPKPEELAPTGPGLTPKKPANPKPRQGQVTAKTK